MRESEGTDNGREVRGDAGYAPVLRRGAAFGSTSAGGTPAPRAMWGAGWGIPTPTGPRVLGSGERATRVAPRMHGRLDTHQGGRPGWGAPVLQ